METPAAKTSFRKARFLILIGLFAGFRIITALLGLRFNSLYAEEIYWVLVSLVFVTWLIAAQRKPKVIAQLILAFSVFYCFVFVACVYFTWLFAGEAAPVKPERFNGMEQEVWIEYHRGILDEKVSEKLCIGKSYFHDWMHRKEDCLELSSPENSTPWAGWKPSGFRIAWRSVTVFSGNRSSCCSTCKQKPVTVWNLMKHLLRAIRIKHPISRKKPFTQSITTIDKPVYRRRTPVSI